jgi:hypothetical protein
VFVLLLFFSLKLKTYLRYGRALYGDVFAAPEVGEGNEVGAAVIDRTLWGELGYASMIHFSVFKLSISPPYSNPIEKIMHFNVLFGWLLLLFLNKQKKLKN